MRPDKDFAARRIAQEAANWVLRQDRGLTAQEQDELSEWLAADARHGAQLARNRRHWSRLDQLVEWRPEHSANPNPDLLAPAPRPRIVRFVSAALGMAAAAVVALVWVPRSGPDSGVPVAETFVAAQDQAPGNLRVLPDGTKIELNRGTAITVSYSPAERRVELERGEAHFTVANDVGRPFVVSAQGIDVRAVGTAFNVRIDTAAVEVLVTEGRVQLNSPARLEPGRTRPTAPAAPGGPVLEPRQRAVVSLTSPGRAPEIATLTAGEVERVLAWQHRLLDFTAAPLNEIVAEFNRRNEVQLVVIDPQLAEIRVSATIRSDNVDGFVRLLEAGFNAQAERRGDAEILLRAGW